MPQNKSPRCQALDSDGKQCRKRTQIQENYHGDHEIYQNQLDDTNVTWVRVYVCVDHALAIGHDFLARRK